MPCPALPCDQNLPHHNVPDHAKTCLTTPCHCPRLLRGARGTARSLACPAMPRLALPSLATPAHTLPRPALPRHVILSSILPNQLAPVRRNDAVSEGFCHHSSMPIICPKNMAASAKCSQVRHFIARQFSALDMVDMAFLKPLGFATSHTLAAISLPYFAACFSPNLDGLARLRQRSRTPRPQSVQSQ